MLVDDDLIDERAKIKQARQAFTVCHCQKIENRTQLEHCTDGGITPQMYMTVSE